MRTFVKNMNGELENKPCAKCRSLNPAGISHCKYCHHSLVQLKAFIDKNEVEKPKTKRNALIASAGIIAAAAGYFWKRKSADNQD